MSHILTMLMMCMRLPLPESAPLMRPRLLVFVSADNGSPFSYFSNFMYLVLQASVSNDKRRTIILKSVLAMNMFSSLEPRTWTLADLLPRSSSNELQVQ
jgi:hypothetical protein